MKSITIHWCSFHQTFTGLNTGSHSDFPGRALGTPLFDSQITETMVPKILEFPQEPHTGRRKRLKHGDSEGSKLSSRKRCPTLLTTSQTPWRSWKIFESAVHYGALKFSSITEPHSCTYRSEPMVQMKDELYKETYCQQDPCKIWFHNPNRLRIAGSWGA